MTLQMCTQICGFQENRPNLFLNFYQINTLFVPLIMHYANTPMQYAAIFHGCKNDNFQMKFFDIFHIFAQNIDCGYTLEPPQRGGSNEYPQSMFWSKNKKKYVYPSKPHIFYIKVGCKGVFITRTCYPDGIIYYSCKHLQHYIVNKCP